MIWRVIYHCWPHQYEILEQSRAELEVKLEDRTRGLIFRSKANWYELGEKGTRYFLNLEKSKYNAKTCYSLMGPDGQTIDNQIEILNAQKDYYQDLYKEDPWCVLSTEKMKKAFLFHMSSIQFRMQN